MDLLLGGFCDAHLAALSENELAEYERLIEAPDEDVLSWLIGARSVPDGYDTPVFRMLVQFHTHSGPLPL
jgi:antitoxin CptB